MKKITFLGSSLDEIKAFPAAAKKDAGYELDRVQHGLDPSNWKPMKTIGPSVREIRIQHQGQYRVIYIAKFGDSIYVLHAFQKKTQKTAKGDLDKARQALKHLQETKR